MKKLAKMVTKKILEGEKWGHISFSENLELFILIPILIVLFW